MLLKIENCDAIPLRRAINYLMNRQEKWTQIRKIFSAETHDHSTKISFSWNMSTVKCQPTSFEREWGYGRSFNTAGLLKFVLVDLNVTFL